MFKQTDLDTKFKIIESVSFHIEKLYKNKDYIKALVWLSSFSNFMKFYYYSYTDGMPKYLNTYNFSKIITDLHSAARQENQPGFRDIYIKKPVSGAKCHFV